jgi:hypothetical protein
LWATWNAAERMVFIERAARECGVAVLPDYEACTRKSSKAGF